LSFIHQISKNRGDLATDGQLFNLQQRDLGELSQARSWLEESLKLQLPLGAPGYVTTLQYLGEVAMYDGSLSEARAYCEEAISMSRDAGLTANLLWSLSSLGNIALQEGNWKEAKEIFTEVLSQSILLGRTGGMILSLEGLASSAAHQSHPDQATRLFAFTTTMRRAKNKPRDALDQRIFDQDLAFAKAQLEGPIFDSLWRDGRALTLEQAVQLALEENHQPIS